MTHILDLKVKDTYSQTSPDTNWHDFGLVHDPQHREVIMPNDRALYGSMRDDLAGHS